jgi:branched-chain amino acid transport system substrate-binding protein
MVLNKSALCHKGGGLHLTDAWYWDLNDETRAFAKRFFDKTGVAPTMTQGGYHSATPT